MAELDEEDVDRGHGDEEQRLERDGQAEEDGDRQEGGQAGQHRVVRHRTPAVARRTRRVTVQ